MPSVLKYIELKSGHANNGPAWIGIVELSKSGRTVYFNGKALKSSGGAGISGNFYDLETGEEYWVFGVKKDGTDRHKLGGGKVKIDRNAIPIYLKLINRKDLDKTKFEEVEVEKTDKQKFIQIENRKIN